VIGCFVTVCGPLVDYKDAIAEAMRIAQRQMAEAQIFIHNSSGQRFLIWQTRMR
jgi:hypothetical protein